MRIEMRKYCKAIDFPVHDKEGHLNLTEDGRDGYVLRFIPVEKLLEEPDFHNLTQGLFDEWLVESRHLVLDTGEVVPGNGLDDALHIIDGVLCIDRLEFLFWIKVQKLRDEFDEYLLRSGNNPQSLSDKQTSDL